MRSRPIAAYLQKSRTLSRLVLAGWAIWLVVDSKAIEEIRLRGETEAAEAVIVGKSERGYVPGRLARRWSRWVRDLVLEGHGPTHVIYSVRLPDGSEITTEAPVSVETWRSLEEGATLPIRYLRAQPRINRPEGAGVGGLLVSLFRLCLGIAFGAIAWFGFRTTRARSEVPTTAG